MTKRYLDLRLAHDFLHDLLERDGMENFYAIGRKEIGEYRYARKPHTVNRAWCETHHVAAIAFRVFQQRVDNSRVRHGEQSLDRFTLGMVSVSYAEWRAVVKPPFNSDHTWLTVLYHIARSVELGFLERPTYDELVRTQLRLLEALARERDLEVRYNLPHSAPGEVLREPPPPAVIERLPTGASIEPLPATTRPVQRPSPTPEVITPHPTRQHWGGKSETLIRKETEP